MTELKGIVTKINGLKITIAVDYQEPLISKVNTYYITLPVFDTFYEKHPIDIAVKNIGKSVIALVESGHIRKLEAKQ